MTRLDAVLHTLDPAGPDLDPRGPRARADLTRILATGPGPGRVIGAGPARPRRARWAVLTAGAVAAGLAVVVTVVLLPLGGDRAFAGWSGTPSAMDAKAAAEAAKSCREHQEDGPSPADPQLATARTALSERRGGWTLVILAGDAGFSAMCLANDDPGLFTDGYIGSIGTPSGYTEPAPRGLRATDLGAGTVANHDVSLIAGHAGADVVGVTYTSSQHGPVAATVSGGRFALWFPGDELDKRPTHGVTVTATYRDGGSEPVTLSLR